MFPEASLCARIGKTFSFWVTAGWRCETDMLDEQACQQSRCKDLCLTRHGRVAKSRWCHVVPHNRTTFGQGSRNLPCEERFLHRVMLFRLKSRSH